MERDKKLKETGAEGVAMEEEEEDEDDEDDGKDEEDGEEDEEDDDEDDEDEEKKEDKLAEKHELAPWKRKMMRRPTRKANKDVVRKVDW